MNTSNHSIVSPVTNKTDIILHTNLKNYEEIKDEINNDLPE